MSGKNPQKLVKEKESLIQRKWGTVDPEPFIETTFFGFPALRHYSIESAFGPDYARDHQNNRFWSSDIVCEMYLKDRTREKVLSLCCGFGDVEQHIVPYLGSVKECLAVDISLSAIDNARKKAKAAGLEQTIKYQLADLNTYNWPNQEYDLVIANGALHHLVNLEDVLGGISKALKAGGILYANEHVGPNYQDHSYRQLELINSMAYLVPPELRRGRCKGHSVKESLAYIWDILTGSQNPPKERSFWSFKLRLMGRMLRIIAGRLPYERIKVNMPVLWTSPKKYYQRTDPSECVRSSEIIPITESLFNTVKVHPYGGPLLAYALDDNFYNRFDNNNSHHKKILELLFFIEATLIEIGEIPMEYAIIIAQNQPLQA